MLDETAFHLPIVTLEELCCSLCKGYLSCSPVCVLPNGGCICGRCSPSSDAPVYRVVPLEAVLKQLSFPCQFKERGCTQKVQFNQTDHEAKCAFRSFACPSLAICKWEGSTMQMLEHFREQHADLVREKAKFKFDVGENVQEVFMVVKNDLVFIISYVVDESLKYDVRYISEIERDVSYKTQLVNNSDAECNINLKINRCLCYDSSFYDRHHAVVVDVNKHLEIMDNPSSVMVVINLKVTELPRNFPNQVVKVDYELLESVRCKRCKNYLIPPLFDVNSVGIVCCECAQLFSRVTTTKNVELQKLVSELYYPCQWQECSFVGKSDNIQLHILSCQFRCYRCFISECNAILKLSSVAGHSKSHENGMYLSNGIYETTFAYDYNPKYVYTIKNNMLLTIKHYAVTYNYVRNLRVTLFSDLFKFTVGIQFAHQHCKLKSEQFILVSNKERSISFDELPSCFSRKDQLSVIIGDCQLFSAQK